MNVRRLTPSDAAAFQALRLASLLDTPLAFGSSHGEECNASLQSVAARLEAFPDRGVLGAFDGDTLVGMVGLGRENLQNLSHKAFIWGMYVSPAYRNRGLAKELLEAAIAFAKSNPAIRQINLCVNAAATAAVSLYQSIGFLTYGHEPDAMLVQGTLYDELHMRLTLSAH
jgi:ribosomal protein S18 acetylase RimI-like enzyme